MWEIAPVGLGGLTAAARNTHLEHRGARRVVEGHRLFFYREAGRHLQDA